MQKLIGKGIPGYVNRMAGFGGMVSSVVDFFKIKTVNQSNETNKGDQKFEAFKGKGTSLG